MHVSMRRAESASARALARSRVTAARPRAAAAHAPTAELAPCGASIDRYSARTTTKSYAACTHTRRRPQIRSNNRSFLSRGRRRLDNGVLLIGRRAVRGAVGGRPSACKCARAARSAVRALCAGAVLRVLKMVVVARSARRLLGLRVSDFIITREGVLRRSARAPRGTTRAHGSQGRCQGVKDAGSPRCTLSARRRMRRSIAAAARDGGRAIVPSLPARFGAPRPPLAVPPPCPWRRPPTPHAAA